MSNKICPFMSKGSGSFDKITGARFNSLSKVECLGENCMAWVHEEFYPSGAQDYQKMQKDFVELLVKLRVMSYETT